MPKNDGESLLALGLMSGTSCDGVDAALLRTDGAGMVEPLSSHFRAYDEQEQALLRRALEDGQGLDDSKARPGCLKEAEMLVTKAHEEAVAQLLADLPDELQHPDVIGFHGQTVWHDPDAGLTVQIGDAQELAQKTGLPVVAQFRQADVAAGGQGAPLVPIYHQALRAKDVLPLPCAVLNIGGVANVTWIDESGELLAFDTGPGNALLNDLMSSRIGRLMDEDGRIAAAGQVDYLALITMMANPYFQKLAPKSLDRNAFDTSPVEQMPIEDAAATLMAFTTETICLGLEQAEQRAGKAAKMVVVCGGGQNNPAMMTQLAGALECPVKLARDLGWDGDALEAQAFAYLAVRHLKDMPLTYPGTTGVSAPMKGGELFSSEPK